MKGEEEAKIGAAADADAVATAKKAGEKAIADVHTNGDLDKVKEAAKAALDEVAEAEKAKIEGDKGLTSKEKAKQLQALADKLAEEKDKIDAAADAAGVATAKGEAETALQGVHQAGDLNQVKDAAKKAIDQAAEREKEEINNDGSLTQPEKDAKLAELEKAKQAAKDKVDAAKDADAVAKAQKEGEKAIDDVHKLGEFKFEIPNNAPSVEVPEYKGTIGSTGVDGNGNLITPPVVEIPEYTGTIGTSDVDENGHIIGTPVVDKPALIITKWTDEQGNELKPAAVKAPAVTNGANEAFEHGEISGYEYVRTEPNKEDGTETHIFRKIDPNGKLEDNNHENGNLNPTPANPEVPNHNTPDHSVVPSNDNTADNTDDTVQNAQPTEVANISEEQNTSANILPNTGTAKGIGIFSAAAASILTGLGLIIPVKKEDEEEEETQNN